MRLKMEMEIENLEIEFKFNSNSQKLTPTDKEILKASAKLLNEFSENISDIINTITFHAETN